MQSLDTMEASSSIENSPKNCNKIDQVNKTKKKSIKKIVYIYLQ